MHRGPVRKPGNELFLQRTFGGRRKKILEKDLLYRSFAGELSGRVFAGDPEENGKDALETGISVHNGSVR